MNIFELTLNTAPTTNENVTYTISIQEYNSNWTTVYYGKVFVAENQTKVRIDIGDILWNHKFDGENYISPVVNSAGDNYVMVNNTANLLNYWYNNVKVEIPDYSASVTKYVNFYQYNMFCNHLDTPSTNTVAFFMNYQPICHLPKTLPSGFTFRQLVWNGTFDKTIDGITTTESRSKLGSIEFTGGSEYYAINGEKVAQFDNCDKPYYLVWMTNSGAMQVQGFLKSSELSIDYNNNKRVDMSNYEWNFNYSVNGKWKLKSDNLSDKDYRAFGEMFSSPYLLLIDTTNGRLYYVNIKDTTYNEKHNTSGNKIYFEINVESAEVKIV